MFFPQQALDAWLEHGRIALVGDELTITPEGRRYQLTGAVRFLAEVAENHDPHGLVGKVKTLEQVAELAGEHCTGSVILGDYAYEVVDGFLGEPVPSAKSSARRSAARSAHTGAGADALARLLEQT